MVHASCKALLALAIAISSVTISEARAAAFDCRYARSHVETLICADAELSKLDSQLEVLFLKVQAEMSGRDGETGAVADPIGAEQRRWRETVRDVCPDAACLRKVYTARIRQVRETWSDALQ